MYDDDTVFFLSVKRQKPRLPTPSRRPSPSIHHLDGGDQSPEGWSRQWLNATPTALLAERPELLAEIARQCPAASSTWRAARRLVKAQLPARPTPLPASCKRDAARTPRRLPRGGGGGGRGRRAPRSARAARPPGGSSASSDDGDGPGGGFPRRHLVIDREGAWVLDDDRVHRARDLATDGERSTLDHALLRESWARAEYDVVARHLAGVRDPAASTVRSHLHQIWCGTRHRVLKLAEEICRRSTRDN